MEITERSLGAELEMRVKGRLDSSWADPLARQLEETIRGGRHRIVLDLSEVTYLSSAGIRVLIKFYKQLQGIQGSFVVSSPSEQVKTVLDLAGLSSLLFTGTAEGLAPASAPTESRQLERGNATFEVFEYVTGASLTCRAIGDPTLLQSCRFGEEHCRAVSFPESEFAVGLGAFGHGFADCRNRFGEFLVAAGAAAYLPTDGTNIPDYLVKAETFVPFVEVLYGLTCAGQFAHLIRFEAKKEALAVALTDLVEVGLEIAGAETAGMVMVAESAGLTGAALRRSPVRQASEPSLFAHPQIREWLSFTAERAYSRSLAVVAGVATHAAPPALAPFVRPLDKNPQLTGHFHAAAFSHRPLKKGELDVKTTVATLFESETLQGVLHLVGDSREIVGAGQSEFVRGACWVGPVTEIGTERK